MPKITSLMTLSVLSSLGFYPEMSGFLKSVGGCFCDFCFENSISGFGGFFRTRVLNLVIKLLVKLAS